MTLNELYDEAVMILNAGLPAPSDTIAKLEAAGYTFPGFGAEDEDDDFDDEYVGYEGNECQCSLCQGEAVSPIEATVKFTDYAHDTTVIVTVDKDGDVWIGALDEGEEILLSREGVEQLAAILEEILDDD